MTNSNNKSSKRGKASCLSLILLAMLAVASPARGQLPANPLSFFPPIAFEDPQITADFVADRLAVIRLGKALFWDMQLGSDGIQACASCHFHAGVDVRLKNQVNPGLAGGDSTFGNAQFPGFAANYTVVPADFPLHVPTIRDVNDVLSSQGVTLSNFVDIRPGFAEDDTTPAVDPVFRANGQNTRRVAGRNTPSSINAVYNNDNFWDGRANNIFNGVNPFGHLDPGATVLRSDAGGNLQPAVVRLRNSSLASQAVGPPLSDFEMSAVGRSFPKLGKKMLTLTPLAKQKVHSSDSVLGPIASAAGKGLTVSYAQLIRQAFRPQWWNSTNIVTFPGGVRTISPDPGRPLTTNEFTQMEANFTLFFGLAVQIYESTLTADQTRFDRFLAGNQNALTAQERDGLNIFLGKGQCIGCHIGTSLSGASILVIQGIEEANAEAAGIELMNMAQGIAFYDTGFYNISVRPSTDDIGRAATSPAINPLTGQNYPLSRARLGLLLRDGLLPPEVAQFVQPLPAGNPPPGDRVAVTGSFKTPGLRNVELTGPYFHNGGAATLEQVVEFYDRGGNFPVENIADFDPRIVQIGFNPTEEAALVAFLKSLTDERVRNESAPFDHPELIIPNGHAADGSTEMLRLPPVGASGRSSEGLLPLQPFPVPLASVAEPPAPAPGVAAGGGGGGGCAVAGAGGDWKDGLGGFGILALVAFGLALRKRSKHV